MPWIHKHFRLCGRVEVWAWTSDSWCCTNLVVEVGISQSISLSHFCQKWELLNNIFRNGTCRSAFQISASPGDKCTAVFFFWDFAKIKLAKLKMSLNPNNSNLYWKSENKVDLFCGGGHVLLMYEWDLRLPATLNSVQ